MPKIAAEIVRRLGGNPIGFVGIGDRDEVHPLVDPIAAAVLSLSFEPDVKRCRLMLESCAM